MPFVDLSGITQIWAESCEKLIAFQHEADEEIATTHVHFLMINSTYATAEQYKRMFYENVHTHEFGEERPKGNELWAWKHKDYPNPDITYIKYMGKGTLKPLFNKGFTEAEIKYQINQWEEREHEVPRVSKATSEFGILLAAAETAIKSKRLNISMKDICCFIQSHYLRARKAVPRKSDTNRYAYSIYAIVKGLTNENDIEKLERQCLIENIDL